MPILQDPNQDIVRFSGLTIEDYSSGLGDYLSTVVDDTYETNPTTSLLRSEELLDKFTDLQDQLIAPDALNEDYRDIGLKFETPAPRQFAELLAENKRAEQARQSALERGPSGVIPATLGIGASLVTSVIDPINLASAFVPVVGESRFAALAARVGVGRARIITGATEGFVGAAAVEPLVLQTQSIQQLDYSLQDSVNNVFFGTVIGSGLHFASGKIGDVLATRRGEPTLKERLFDAQPATREAALRAAVSQEAQGIRTNVEPVFRTDPQFGFKQDLRNSSSLVGHGGGERFVPTGSPFDTAAPGKTFDSIPVDLDFRVPLTDKKGAPLRFETAEKAEASLKRRKNKGDDTFVVQKLGDNTYTIQKKAKSKIVRKSDGGVRSFRTPRLAKKFVANQLDNDKAFKVFPVIEDGKTKFAIVDAVDEADVTALTNNIDAVTIPTPPRVNQLRPQVVQQAMEDAARYVTNVENIRVADPVAAREIAAEVQVKGKLQRTVTDSDLTDAIDDVDLASTELEQVARDLGLNEDFVSRELKQYDDNIQRAEAIGKGYEAAALCQLRS